MAQALNGRIARERTGKLTRSLGQPKSAIIENIEIEGFAVTGSNDDRYLDVMGFTPHIEMRTIAALLFHRHPKLRLTYEWIAVYLGTTENNIRQYEASALTALAAGSGNRLGRAIMIVCQRIRITPETLTASGTTQTVNEAPVGRPKMLAEVFARHRQLLWHDDPEKVRVLAEIKKHAFGLYHGNAENLFGVEGHPLKQAMRQAFALCMKHHPALQMKVDKIALYLHCSEEEAADLIAKLEIELVERAGSATSQDAMVLCQNVGVVVSQIIKTVA